MSSSYGLKIIPSSAASLAGNRQVSDGSLVRSLGALVAIVPPVSHPKGEVLFMEGQAACGIFALCSGG